MMLRYRLRTLLIAAAGLATAVVAVVLWTYAEEFLAFVKK
jgi:hypothetical protein